MYVCLYETRENEKPSEKENLVKLVILEKIGNLVKQVIKKEPV